MSKVIVSQLLCAVLLLNLGDATRVPDIKTKNTPIHQQRWPAGASHKALWNTPPVPTNKGESFTVERHKNPKFVRNGPAAKEQAFSKYGWDVNATPTHTFARQTANAGPEATGVKKRQGQVGTVQATPEQLYSEYLCPVSIGGQTLMIDFGTSISRCIRADMIS